MRAMHEAVKGTGDSAKHAQVVGIFVGGHKLGKTL